MEVPPHSASRKPETGSGKPTPTGLFNESNNILITGGDFRAVSNIFYPQVHPVSHMGPINYKDPVSCLRVHSATAGLLNARERFDAPKCDEDTRIAILRGMREWVQAGDESSGPSMYWLHGPAGVGKSALAQSLALMLDKEGDHAASFFFSRAASGRNNGGQLISTLACQLAIHIPHIRPFMSQSLQDDPLVFDSSNVVQTEKLIIHPVNNMHHQLRPSKSRITRALRFLRKPGKSRSPNQESPGSKIPRLILIDGLDECDNPDVQCNLILCLGHAVRDMRLPFRVIITSRPEAHILATFRLNQLFNTAEGVSVREQNLGNDPDADRSITTYLLKEFAQIRRTHPLRRYLPTVWPSPTDIDYLIQKSSQSFVYAATVIRYIKLPNNRPEECLERVLGLAEIPSLDKPYEILDNLYHHIFASVPETNKKSVGDIFRILVVGTGLQVHPRLGSCTTPAEIEKICAYKPGHVEHVLGDLLCVVNCTVANHPVEILHASLFDFFLDITRAQHLYVDPEKAHALVARGYYMTYVQSQGRLVDDLNRCLVHIKLGERLVFFHGMELVDCHKMAFSRLQLLKGAVFSPFIESSLSLASLPLVLWHKGYPNETVTTLIHELQLYLFCAFPVVESVFRLIEDFEPYIVPLLRHAHHNHWFLASLLKDFAYNSVPRDVAVAHILILIPMFLPVEAQAIRMCNEEAHAGLSILWIQSFLRTDARSTDYTIIPLCFEFIRISLENATFSPTLIQFLESAQVFPRNDNPLIMAEDLQRLEPMVLRYLRRIRTDSLAMTGSLLSQIDAAESLWDGIASR